MGVSGCGWLRHVQSNCPEYVIFAYHFSKIQAFDSKFSCRKPVSYQIINTYFHPQSNCAVKSFGADGDYVLAALSITLLLRTTQGVQFVQGIQCGGGGHFPGHASVGQLRNGFAVRAKVKRNQRQAQ